MTTDLEGRKAYWETQCNRIWNWTVYARDLAREQAQKKEDEVATRLGCVFSGGGDDPDDPHATWAVYSFQYDKLR